MAIELIYLSVVIPLDNVEKCKAIGGVKGILEMQKAYVGKRVLLDDYLYKDGAMGPDGISGIVDFWQRQGLTPTELRDGIEIWKDLCVVDFTSGPTAPCDWLEFDRSGYPMMTVWMKGKPKGELVKMGQPQKS